MPEQGRRKMLDDFLLDYLPDGTPQEIHDTAMVMMEAVRADIIRRLDPATRYEQKEEEVTSSPRSAQG